MSDSKVDASRDPEDIARDIERTRSNLSQSVSDLQHRFEPDQLFDQAASYIDEQRDDIVDFIRENPVPVAITAVGVAWIIASLLNPARTPAERARAAMIEENRLARRRLAEQNVPSAAEFDKDIWNANVNRDIREADLGYQPPKRN